jgi:hypothetical protein
MPGRHRTQNHPTWYPLRYTADPGRRPSETANLVGSHPRVFQRTDSGLQMPMQKRPANSTRCYLGQPANVVSGSLRRQRLAEINANLLVLGHVDSQ